MSKKESNPPPPLSREERPPPPPGPPNKQFRRKYLFLPFVETEESKQAGRDYDNFILGRVSAPTSVPSPAFPYGINPSMDDHAAKKGFPHWSCVSPKSNEWWVRKDDHSLEATFQGERGYLSDLAEYDKNYPMAEK